MLSQIRQKKKDKHFALYHLGKTKKTKPKTTDPKGANSYDAIKENVTHEVTNMTYRK